MDKKDFVINLKKKKFLFSKEKVDEKKFRLSELGNKCNLEKDVKLANCDVTLLF